MVGRSLEVLVDRMNPSSSFLNLLLIFMTAFGELLDILDANTPTPILNRW